MGAKSFAVRGPALGISKSVEFKYGSPADPEHIENSVAEGNDFDIGLWLCRADELDTDLVELPQASFLRPLVAKHRPAVKKFQRHGLDQAIGKHGSDDSRRVLGAQRDFVTTAINEGVHLFGDDIASLADRPTEHLGELEDRRFDLGKAVKFSDGTSSLGDLPVPPRRVGKKVLSAADRLQGTHTTFSDYPRRRAEYVDHASKMLAPDRSLKGHTPPRAERRHGWNPSSGEPRALVFSESPDGLKQPPLPFLRGRDTRHSVIRVSGVAESIPEEIKGQHSNDDANDRQHQPRIQRHDVDVLGLAEKHPPTRHWRAQPETEK